MDAVHHFVHVPATLAIVLALGPACGRNGVEESSVRTSDASAIREDRATHGTASPTPYGRYASPLVLGVDHACLLEPAGTVRCAGQLAQGELGDGRTAKTDCPWGCEFAYDVGCLGYRRCRSNATRVLGLVDAVRLATDGYRTCALRRSGEVRCWGPSNENARVQPRPDDVCAPGGAPDRCAPAPTGAGATLDQSNDLALGGNTLCVLRPDGAVACARGPSNADATTPILDLMPIPSATAVAAGGTWCALTVDGAVHCGGGFLAGHERDSDPVRIDALDGIHATQVTVGGTHACVLDGAGTAWCWGANPFGETGQTATCAGNQRSCAWAPQPPAPVPGVPPLVHLEASPRTTCGIARDASLHCWGAITKTGAPERIAESVEWAATQEGAACYLTHGALRCRRAWERETDAPGPELQSLFAPLDASR